MSDPARRVTRCPPAAPPLSLDAQPTGEPFYALRTSLGDWSTGPTSEWVAGEGCLRVRGGGTRRGK
jgi:hypothetical protein